MAVTHLIDTNIIAEPLKEFPNAAVDKQLRYYEGSLALAATTWHELIYGYQRTKSVSRRKQLSQYLYDAVAEVMLILPYNDAAAEWHAVERARLSSIGIVPSFQDGQIAAVAAVNNLILVTRNVSDFEHFAGLIVVNWFQET